MRRCDVRPSRQYASAMCEGKHRFATWGEAHAVPKYRRRRWKLRSTDVYRCPFCQGFHRGNG